MGALAPAFPRKTLSGSTLEAGRALLGARLVQAAGWNVRVGRIVEVEAYVGEDDEACHARFGPTKRNAVMFGPPGHAYVYLVYGMYCCLNVVTEVEGRAAALLVRAVEPLDGIDAMRAARQDWETRRRAGDGRAAARASVATKDPERRAGGPGEGRSRGLPVPARGNVSAARQRVSLLPAAALASGPGVVCVAFSIDRADNGADLCDPRRPLHLEPARADDPPVAVMTGPRIGIGYAGEPWRSLPWRLWVAGSPAVSGARGGRR
jgi:DNA-3-methyladenine glycosylase